MKNSSHLLSKIRELESQIQDKNNLLSKYTQALQSSNVRIKKIAKNLEEGLSLINGIHNHLIPVNLPDIPYFEFSYKFLPTRTGVSGDFFDVVKIKDSLKFGIILSNCDSYSVLALFLSSLLKSTENLKNYETSKDFLTYIASHLSSQFSKSKKVSLFYGIVDRKNFTLDYCMVGDVFVGFKKQDENYQILPACTQEIRDINFFKSEVIDLDARDRLLLCSPGVASNKNSKNETFGESNILKAALEAEKRGVLGIRQNILFQCNEFNQGIDPAQDRTVLVIESKDRVLKLTRSNIS